MELFNALFISADGTPRQGTVPSEVGAFLQAVRTHIGQERVFGDSDVTLDAIHLPQCTVWVDDEGLFRYPTVNPPACALVDMYGRCAPGSSQIVGPVVVTGPVVGENESSLGQDIIDMVITANAQHQSLCRLLGITRVAKPVQL